MLSPLSTKNVPNMSTNVHQNVPEQEACHITLLMWVDQNILYASLPASDFWLLFPLQNGCLCSSADISHPKYNLNCSNIMRCDTSAETYFPARSKCFDIVWDLSATFVCYICLLHLSATCVCYIFVLHLCAPNALTLCGIWASATCDFPSLASDRAQCHNSCAVGHMQGIPRTF